MNNYQVKFFVSAIIGIETKASSPEEAIDKARKRIKAGIFKNGIEHLAGTEEESGYDNLDAWDRV